MTKRTHTYGMPIIKMIAVNVHFTIDNVACRGVSQILFCQVQLLVVDICSFVISLIENTFPDINRS